MELLPAHRHIGPTSWFNAYDVPTKDYLDRTNVESMMEAMGPAATRYFVSMLFKSLRNEKAMNKTTFETLFKLLGSPTDPPLGGSNQTLWFEAYDVPNKGYLDQTNVKSMMKAMGFPVPDDAYISELFEKIGDEDNNITPTEFERLFNLLGSPTDPPPGVLFKAFDVNTKGYLDRTNVKSMMKAMGFHVPDDAYIRKLFENIGPATDNQITLPEFERLFKLLGSPTDPPLGGSNQTLWFKAFDVNTKGYLDRTNVKSMMEAMGFGPDDDYVSKLFEKIGDDDNKITPTEFENLFKLLGSPTDPPPEGSAADGTTVGVANRD